MRMLKGALALLVGVVVAASAGRAEDAAAFYKGKTFRFIAGAGVGGGYDAYARLLAPHLGKALGANAIVENQPGAGGLAALNRIYSTEPTGLEVLILNGGGAVLSQLFDLPTVKYDLAKLQYLATVSASPWLVLVAPTSPYTSVADMMRGNAPIRWAAVGLIDGLSDGASMVCEGFALQCKVVMGYKSSSEGALAIARGEMDALYVSDTSANNYVKAGHNKAIATVGRARSQFFPDVPTVFESMKLTPEQTYWMELRANVDALGRILVTTPGIPRDRLAYLKAAVEKVLTDPAVIAEGDKTQRYVAFEDDETTRQRALSVIANTTPERKVAIKDVVTKKYVPGGGQ
ncbi:MAG: Bug family tripartite tricarboxylate transporter substrate binding protein [Gemmatimonas sp.]